MALKRLKATITVPGRVWLVLPGAEGKIPEGDRLVYMVGDSVPGARLIIDGENRGQAVTVRPTQVETYYGLEGDGTQEVIETEVDCWLELGPFEVPR